MPCVTEGPKLWVCGALSPSYKNSTTIRSWCLRGTPKIYKRDEWEERSQSPRGEKEGNSVGGGGRRRIISLSLAPLFGQQGRRLSWGCHHLWQRPLLLPSNALARPRNQEERRLDDEASPSRLNGDAPQAHSPPWQDLFLAAHKSGNSEHCSFHSRTKECPRRCVLTVRCVC